MGKRISNLSFSRAALSLSLSLSLEYLSRRFKLFAAIRITLRAFYGITRGNEALLCIYISSLYVLVLVLRRKGQNIVRESVSCVREKSAFLLRRHLYHHGKSKIRTSVEKETRERDARAFAFVCGNTHTRALLLYTEGKKKEAPSPSPKRKRTHTQKQIRNNTKRPPPNKVTRTVHERAAE